MTKPADTIPESAVWLRDVVEPIARRLDLGAVLGISPAHATPNPSTGVWPLAQSLFARGVDVGEIVVKIVSTFTADVVRIITHGSGRAAVVANPIALGLGSAAAGSTATKTLSISNDTASPFNAVQLLCRGFLGTRGAHIPAEAIRFTPTLANVAAHSSADVAMQVDVAHNIRAGAYVALVEVAGQPDVWIVATLDVL